MKDDPWHTMLSRVERAVAELGDARVEYWPLYKERQLAQRVLYRAGPAGGAWLAVELLYRGQLSAAKALGVNAIPLVSFSPTNERADDWVLRCIALVSRWRREHEGL